MKIKGVLLLGAMSLLLIALAAPAAASASVWKHEGVDVTSGEESFTGTVGFTGLGSGIECEGHTVVTLTGSRSGVVVSLTVTTNTCEGTGLFEGCEVVIGQSTTPWPVDVTENDIDITNVVIHAEFDPQCPASSLTVSGPSITGELDTPSAISTVTLSGEVELETDVGTLPGEIGGTLHAFHPGTYGIG